MKKYGRIIALVLFATILLSTIAFAGSGYGFDESLLTEFSQRWEKIQSDETIISLTPGAKAGEIGFSWVSSLKDIKPVLKVGEKEDLSDATEYTALQKLTINAKHSNKVTLNGLTEGKTYYYAYTENGVWSEVESFKVQDDKDFTVLFVSDAQIGRSGDEKQEEVLVRDTCGWNDTVEKMTSNYPDAAFIISSGDQLETSTSTVQMKAYLSPEKLRSIPIANAIGNHDFTFPLYSYYSNNPNTIKEKFASPAGNGYYYTYGDALFIVINSNDMIPSDVSNLLKKAVSACPDAKWRVAVMHHSPYSACSNKDDFSLARAVFTPLFDTYDIDICLSGHDHVYSRTVPMIGGKVADSPDGTVYIEASSASGSNFGGAKNEASYFKCISDEKIPTYTALTFSDDVVNVSTYRTDTNEPFDTFEINDNPSFSSNKTIDIIIRYFKTISTMM